MSGSAAEVTPAVPFSVNAQQAREVGVVIGFLDAFNARQLQRALSYLSSDIGVTDCDYRRVRVVQSSGKPAVSRWLSQRFADRDVLRVSRIYNENADAPSGVVAVEFELRANNTLRALGFPSGIKPQPTAKVIFTTSGTTRITRLANGPFGGSPEICKPR